MTQQDSLEPASDSATFRETKARPFRFFDDDNFDDDNFDDENKEYGTI